MERYPIVCAFRVEAGPLTALEGAIDTAAAERFVIK